ncbi:hypothetical protein R3P38DRAFT_2489699, partial [Favolaschia claudopus]
VVPQKPLLDDYLYAPEELSSAPMPIYSTLSPPSPHPNDPLPPKHFLYPQAPVFTLRKTSAYYRGYVYVAPYSREDSIATDHYRMLRVAPPSQLTPKRVDGIDGPQYLHEPVPGCVQMVPGVPYAFEIDGDPNELHTIGAAFTFQSLRFDPDFWDIYKDTLLVIKGLRGCRKAGNTDAVFPITHWPIRTNDRSPATAPAGSKTGSYNLASTLLKGNGPGVVLPAAQVDMQDFSAQVSTVLQAASRLRRRLLRKTLSKAEFELLEFNCDDMNVVGFGGLEPTNATGSQLNLSSLGDLFKNLGIQGSPHADSNDEETARTHFMMAVDLPPNSNPGAFLLARAGLYVREVNCWIIHLVFDGTDIHSGFEPSTLLTREELKHWVETELETAWRHSEISRIGLVSYSMRSAHNRDTYMSMTPSVRFGNCGPELPPKQRFRDYATHGQEILGGQEAWANRMGRELVAQLWNGLQQCNLDLGVDVDTLSQSISFKGPEGNSVQLEPLPLHPLLDREKISRMRSQFEY